MTFIILTFAAVLTLSRCGADQLPPPTELSYEWIDPITVNVFWSWKKPSTLPEECSIIYEIDFLEKNQHGPRRTSSKSISDRCPREDMNVHHWMYTVRTIAPQSCDGWFHSTRMNLTVYNQKVELVRDFRCVLALGGNNCSWIPVDPSVELKFSYRSCSSERSKHLKECDQPYSSGKRKGCFIKEINPDDPLDVRYLVNSTTGLDIIKPFLVLPSPKLSIAEDKGLLKLSWTPPSVGKSCSWTYEFCFRQCGGQVQCQNNTFIELPHRMPYEENCMYTFRSRALSGVDCPTLISDWSEDVKYGTTKPPDSTLSVVAIVIPIILFICVTLSCYCFRKHSNIICPDIPDPSAIFKEMMSGHKEYETETKRLHTLVPEAVETSKISQIMENNTPQENV